MFDGTVIIGIDPGEHGAVVVLSPEGFTRAFPFPWLDDSGADAKALASLLRFWMDGRNEIYVVLEVSNAFAGAGRTMGAVSAQTTGRTQGVVEGVCAALGLPLELVEAKTWQTILEPSTLVFEGRVKSGRTDDERTLSSKERARRIALKRADVKARSIASVRRRLPNLGLIWPRCRKESDGIADAANMCLWRRGLQQSVDLKK